jgi:iron complex outermembrane receptor protein
LEESYEVCAVAQWPELIGIWRVCRQFPPIAAAQLVSAGCGSFFRRAMRAVIVATCVVATANAQTSPERLSVEEGATPTSVDAPHPGGRSEENAVSQATDAFGVVIGREELGLYDATDVRGFSPIAAGNARIDGLYFDPVYQPNTRITDSTTIHVGIAAQGSPFIAPTGIVDYVLRRPDDTATLSTLISGDNWSSRSIEADATLPLVGKSLDVGAGIYAGRQAYGDGTHDKQVNEAAELRWRPTAGIDILPFWTRTVVYDAVPSPIYIPSIEVLPERLPRGHDSGPDWPRDHQIGNVGGVVATAELPGSLRLSASAFHSSIDTPVNFTSLRAGFDEQGQFQQLIIADPPLATRSDSGEIRLTKEVQKGLLLQRIHLSLRARDRVETYGGSDTIDIGDFHLGQPIVAKEPVLVFGPTSRDEERQWTAGVSYQAQWSSLAELGVSAMKTRYRKQVDQPDLAEGVSRSAPWLVSMSAASHLTGRLAVYGSYAQGLEDSAAAPDIATNRGQPAPALRTHQIDGGVRWLVHGDLTAVLGGFVLRKPYFDLDETNRYVKLGAIRNEGIEFSLTGHLASHLEIVLGTLLQRPRVMGEAVTKGIVESRPTGILARTSILDVDWKLSFLKGLSADAAVESRSREVSTTDDRVGIPSRTTLDLGARYRFAIGKKQALFRLLVSNVTDIHGLVSEGDDAYSPLPGTSVSAYLTLDV